jgi:alkylhydroperoxidase family enzyme
MFGFLVRWGIRRAEKKLGEPLDYLRELHAHAPGAFWQFFKVAKAAAYRSKLPAPAFHVARIVAVRIQDCGPCVQTCVNLAKADGVDPAVLTAALARDFDALPESLRDVAQFADAITTNAGDPDPLRERLTAVFGKEGVAELALALALCQTFPILKRGLGHAKSCSAVPAVV